VTALQNKVPIINMIQNIWWSKLSWSQSFYAIS